MTKPYTLHFEMADGTLDRAYTSSSNKALALRIARIAASQKPWGVSNIVVCKDDLTVATFPIRPFGVYE